MLQLPDLFVEGSYQWKLFRRRFRMPPDVFRMVCSVLKPHMPDANDVVGRAGVPLELKVLGYLRVLGRGWYFDDVAESTGMSEETARVSFHQIAAVIAFGELGRLHLDTLSDDELSVTLNEFEEVYLPGCVGSTDCVHVRYDGCPAQWSNIHVDKTGKGSLVWQATVNRRLKFLHLTAACAGSWNDKQVVMTDDFILGLYNRTLFPTHQTYTVQGNVRGDGGPVQRSGLYTIVDGGYAEWWCLQAANKHALEPLEEQWSAHVLAVRKDVERAFGVLKNRFRLFKNPVLWRDTAKLNAAFRSAAVLHNMLIELADDVPVFEEDALHDDEEDGIEVNSFAVVVVDHELHLPSLRVPLGTSEAAGNEGAAMANHALHDDLVAHFAYMQSIGAVHWQTHNIRSV